MGNMICALIPEPGWTQHKLANPLDVSRQSVNAIEAGKYYPPATGLRHRPIVRAPYRRDI